LALVLPVVMTATDTGLTRVLPPAEVVGRVDVVEGPGADSIPPKVEGAPDRGRRSGRRFAPAR